MNNVSFYPKGDGPKFSRRISRTSNYRTRNIEAIRSALISMGAKGVEDLEDRLHNTTDLELAQVVPVMVRIAR